MAKSKRPQPQSPEEPPEEQELSLDALTTAFAEALRQPAEAMTTEPAPKLPAAPAIGAAPGFIESIAEADSLASSPGDEQCEISPQSILEALLFVGDPSGGPIPAERLAGVMRGVEPAEIHDLVEELNRRYDHAGSPYRIVSEGAGYRLSLREQFASIRDKFFGKVKQARLSQAAVDVLALVAYHQPVSAENVGQLRGAPSGAVLSQLVRRQLLSVERPDPASRVIHYRTTRRFLDVFGLASLDDLPTSRDLDEK